MNKVYPVKTSILYHWHIRSPKVNENHATDSIYTLKIFQKYSIVKVHLENKKNQLTVPFIAISN